MPDKLIDISDVNGSRNIRKWGDVAEDLTLAITDVLIIIIDRCGCLGDDSIDINILGQSLGKVSMNF